MKTNKNKILSELAKMNFNALTYAMRGYSTMQQLVEHLAWAYINEDVTSGRMREDLEYAYETSN